jgi:ribonuclease HI
MTERVIAACDGACKGNPGPAGWAWVVMQKTDGGTGRWQAGPLGQATNNIAELTALERLLSAVDRATPLEVRMDSQYAMKAATEWLPSWKKRGWKTTSGSPVKNQELVVRIDALLADRDVRFVYVPAHQVGGDVLNAFVDQAASQAALSQRAADGILTDLDDLTLEAEAFASSGAATRTAKRERSSGTVRTIPAKYPGTCRCGRRYEAGTPIAKNSQGWGHPECAAQALPTV